MATSLFMADKDLLTNGRVHRPGGRVQPDEPGPAGTACDPRFRVAAGPFGAEGGGWWLGRQEGEEVAVPEGGGLAAFEVGHRAVPGGAEAVVAGLGTVAVGDPFPDPGAELERDRHPFGGGAELVPKVRRDAVDPLVLGGPAPVSQHGGRHPAPDRLPGLSAPPGCAGGAPGVCGQLPPPGDSGPLAGAGGELAVCLAVAFVCSLSRRACAACSTAWSPSSRMPALP